MNLPLICLLLLLVIMMLAVGAEAKSAYRVDIGGPVDELFIGEGWYATEGPYDQWSEIWRSRCRWCSQGATLTIPTFPGVENTVELRAEIIPVPETEQRLLVYINGEKRGDFKRADDFRYIVKLSPDTIDDSGWAEMKLETAVQPPRNGGDLRDLRVVVDWVEITADAPVRPYLCELMISKTKALPHFTVDVAPQQWRMFYDPNNIGDTYSINRYDKVSHDDSAYTMVKTSYIPEMQRGDAVWYRAWVGLDKNADAVRKNLILPGNGFEFDGARVVWVNGEVVSDGPGSLKERTAKLLVSGPNLIIVKLMKGPFPKPSGDSIVAKAEYVGEWNDANVFFSPGTLELRDEFSSTDSLVLKLVSPNGKTVGEVTAEVIDLENGSRGVKSSDRWLLEEFGEHTLIIKEDNYVQKLPVHYLGVHFFHWGWYTGGGGTIWNGYQPCSNDYLDQLFNRIGEWGVGHHSITWGGAIIEPGAGFHGTQGVDYIKKHREAFADGLLEFVGAPFPPRNVCIDFGESLIRSMRRSIKLYESQFGFRPHRFTSHDATLTPLLPQIMRMCDYDTYILPENWWGMGQSIPGSRDCMWRTQDGTVVRCLDSWYHGTSPTIQARRAVQQGKPAVLCNEEFACLDATVFLNHNEAHNLAREGIFLKPIDLDEYQRVTEEFAKQLVYEGDDHLCYKGWTGGGEGEVEFEKMNRILETKLVALENLVALARYAGIGVDQAPIDHWWGRSLRNHECHMHWGNGYPSLYKELAEGVQFADAEIARLGRLITEKIPSDNDGVVVFNPLGADRNGLVKLRLPDDAKALVANRKSYPVQPDPNDPGSYLVSLPELPSCGYRCYDISNDEATGKGVTAVATPDNAVLDNGLVRISVAADGRITSVVDSKTGETLLKDANLFYMAKPEDQVPNKPLSVEPEILNLDYYLRPIARSMPKVVAEGPVIAVVECELAAEEYPKVGLKMRVSLANGERQARITLTAAFDEPTVVWPKGGKHPHEGTYIPGMFIRFPMDANTKPMVDMAYCITDDVMTSTNHNTFLNIPFRNATFNALSLAGPNTGEYAVLTKGIHDFFKIWSGEPYLGMSLGMGADNCPYKYTYCYEYALLAPERSNRENIDFLAYRAAREFLTDPVAVDHKAGNGELPVEMSFIKTFGDSVMVPGIEYTGGKLVFRVVNLDDKPVNAIIQCPNIDRASVVPEGEFAENGRLTLGPRTVREVQVDLCK